MYANESEYEQAAKQTLEMYDGGMNAEIDLEALAKRYTCQEDDCGKIFFDQGKPSQFKPSVIFRILQETLDDSW